MLWFVNSNRSIQKIVFTPFIHCYYLLSCFVISLEIKFDVFCVNSESGGVCVFRLAKIPSNAPLVFKNGWKIILMTESCWEWYKVHFYTKTLDINIMLTFSTQKIRFCMKLQELHDCIPSGFRFLGFWVLPFFQFPILLECCLHMLVCIADGDSTPLHSTKTIKSVAVVQKSWPSDTTNVVKYMRTSWEDDERRRSWRVDIFLLT